MDALARSGPVATLDAQALARQVRLALARWENEGGALPASAVLAARALGFDLPEHAGSGAAGRIDSAATQASVPASEPAQGCPSCAT